MQVLLTPGLWLQKLTTREPDDQQLEVALAALAKVLELEQNPVPEVVEPVLVAGSRRIVSERYKHANPLEEGNILQLDFSKLVRATAKCPDIIP